MLVEHTHDLPEPVSPQRKAPTLPRPLSQSTLQQHQRYAAALVAQAALKSHPRLTLPAWNRRDLFWVIIGLIVSIPGMGGLVYLGGKWLYADQNNDNVEIAVYTTATTIAFLSTFIAMLFIVQWRGHTLRDVGFRWPSLPWFFGAIIVGIIGIPARLLVLLFVAVLFDIPLFEATEEESSGEIDALFWVAFVQLLAILVILAPLAEEMVFRGILYNAVRGRYGIVLGTLVSGAVFGLAHIDPLLVISNTVMGLALALCYEYSKSLWVTIIIHFVNNAIVAFFLLLAVLLAGAG